MSMDYGTIFFGIFRDTIGRLVNGFGQLSIIKSCEVMETH